MSNNVQDNLEPMQTVRTLLLSKGYKLTKETKDDPFVRQEFKGEPPAKLWRADGQGAPTVIVGESEKGVVIVYFELSGPTRPKPLIRLTEELRSALAATCGPDAVKLV